MMRGSYLNNESPTLEEVQTHIRMGDGRWNKRGAGNSTSSETILIIEEMSKEWSSSSICPIYKKRSKLDYTNYRGISLLNVGRNRIISIYIII